MIGFVTMGHAHPPTAKSKPVVSPVRSPVQPHEAPAAPLVPKTLLSLQRSAGNRAVQRLVGSHQSSFLPRSPTPVALPLQRLSAASASLAADVGESKARSFGMGSTFAHLHKTLAAYEKLSTSEDAKVVIQKENLLQKLGTLCARYINEHRNPRSERDTARMAVARRLVDEIPMELVAISKQRAEDKYMSNFLERGSEGALTAADSQSRLAASDAQDDYKQKLHSQQVFKSQSGIQEVNDRMATVEGKGLSRAEHAAISAYSLGDYKYMNAATANDTGWMEGVKASDYGKQSGWDKMSNQTIKEEGSLHSAVAVKGLAKLDPYPGVTYRGEERSEAEMAKKVAKGNTYEFLNLTSTSKLKDTALGFSGSGGKDKVSVVWVITNGGGRDISALSLSQGEDEVLLLVGTKVTVVASYLIDTMGETDGDQADTDFSDVLEGLKRAAKRNGKKYLMVQANGLSAPDAGGNIDVKSPTGDSMNFEKRPEVED
jgi:hypothetical protein